MANQASPIVEAPLTSSGGDQVRPARERALKQWRGDERAKEPQRGVPETPEQEVPAAEPPAETAPVRRGGRLRRHPLGAALGAMLLLAAGAGGYLYYDAAGRFETTDDAFIAARQFSIAPKV